MGNGPADDLACVSGVLRGDEAAAEALVERLRPLVVAVVRRRLPARMDEADMVQSVFLRVFAKLEHYGGKAPLEHWVSRIAVNVCLNELRRPEHRLPPRHLAIALRERVRVQAARRDPRARSCS